MRTKEKVLNGIAKKIEKKIKREQENWPPVCFGPFYQPKRPNNQTKKL